MYCDQVRHKLNQFVDTELSAFESHALQRHLDDCTECSLLLRELRLVRDALSALVRLSEGNRRRMRRALLRQTHRKWSDYPREVLDNLRSCLRDLDRHAAVCRLSAVPLSLAMMVLLAYQLPQLRSQNWTFQIYATQQSSPSTANRPPVLVQGAAVDPERQRPAGHGLEDPLRRLLLAGGRSSTRGQRRNRKYSGVSQNPGAPRCSKSHTSRKPLRAPLGDVERFPDLLLPEGGCL